MQKKININKYNLKLNKFKQLKVINNIKEIQSWKKGYSLTNTKNYYDQNNFL